MLKKSILKYLKKTGLKPYQLADLCKVPRPTLYRFLSGKRTITLKTAERIEAVITRSK